MIHNITHHGNRPEVIAELRGHEEGQFPALNDFLSGLAGAKGQDQSLLDRTMVLYGTCMGSANSHSSVNLPVLLAGGGFKHGSHIAFGREKNYPLSRRRSAVKDGKVSALIDPARANQGALEEALKKANDLGRQRRSRPVTRGSSIPASSSREKG